MNQRRTKIVATLGPATDGPGMVDHLIAAGVDAARLNCSHGNADDLRRRSRRVREASARARRAVALLFDLQGPKIRLVGATPERTFALGERVTFTGPEDSGAEYDRLHVAFPDFASLLTERSQIVVGDGTPRFTVLDRGLNDVVAVVSSAGTVGPRKGVSVTHAQPNLPAITEKDVGDIQVAAEQQADFVALSFVRSAADIQELRGRLRDVGSDARVIAKIEKVEAFENLDDILQVADGVMVARGDYGVEAGLARVPLMQKNVIHRANDAGKLVITATQMLESMLTSPEPTRAEATDVANAVIDGTSAVMLSGETSVGGYAVEAVRTMAELALVAEETPEIYESRRVRDGDSADAAVMYAAVGLARDTDAAALVIPTVGGGTPRTCATDRPRRPMIALTPNPRVVTQLALEWGVYPRQMALPRSTDERIERSLRCAKEFANLPSGARVVVTVGSSAPAAGATNLITVREIP